ncbi:MAG: hypothetical protein QNK04_07490 [Myxococcota bacterium]|nr:hypothetical protein [Myxococcota bacterium]
MRTRAWLPLACLLLALDAPAQELQPWDQEAVTGIATRMSAAITEARRAARRDPSVADTRDRRTLRFLESIRRLETAAKQLAAALQEGQGREQTESIALRVRKFLRNAEQAAVGIPKTLQTAASVAPALELLAQIAPYYFPPGEPPTDPA